MYKYNKEILFILIFIFLCVTIVLFVKNIKKNKIQKMNKNKILNGQEINEKGEIILKSPKEKKEFLLYSTKVKKNKIYYVSVNKSNSRLFLTQNKKLASKFTIEPAENTEDIEKNLLSLKVDSYLVNYEYPSQYSNDYEIYATEPVQNNTTLLKFSVNKKHKCFAIKLDNDMNITYNPETMLLYGSFSYNINKKLFVLIDEIE